MAAGARGFLGVADGHFVYEDGSRARFWGVNLTSAACFPEKAQAAVYAGHLADLGFNLVRLRHCDSPFAGLVGRDRVAGEGPVLDPERQGRFDWFVSELEAHGISVFLELATLRTFSAADGPEGPFAGVPSGHKLLPMFDPAWRDAYLDWGRLWLGRTNPYTGLERALYEDLRQLVRDELGFRVPLTPTIAFGQPALAELVDGFAFVDTHFAFDTPKQREVIGGRSLVADPRRDRGLERMALAHDARPACVSEVNHTYPNPAQAEGPLLWASVASVQDWDCVIWFDYVNGPLALDHGGVRGPHELRDAVVRWAQMPAASALFLSGELQPASGHRLRRSFGPAAPAPVPGVPGDQVGWWPEAGRLWIETRQLQAVVGDHLGGTAGVGEGGGPTSTSRLDVRLDGFAAVSLWCLEGPGLDQATRALLTVAGRQHNLGQLTTPSGEHLLAWGVDESRLVRPAGSVRFAWPRKPTVRPVLADGTRGDAVPVSRDGGGWWRLELADAGPTLWWEIWS